MEPHLSPVMRRESAQYRRRARQLTGLAVIAVALIVIYTIVFHILMAHEGQQHSLATGLYWTITTMTTLGYGDVTFTSDAGRLFSLLVLVSGAVLIALLIPFGLIQFVIVPWLDQRDATRVPRRIPDEIRGHLIIAGLNAVTQALIARAKRSDVPSVVLLPDPTDAQTLIDEGYTILIGPLDSSMTYRNAGAERARMVVATLPDTTNTNVAFTVRQVDKNVTIAVTADKPASADGLELAGADHVLQLGATLGKEMADRVLGTTCRAHLIGSFGATQVAEAAVRHSPLSGMTVREARAHIDATVRILAVMRHGRLRPADPGLRITDNTILILAGLADELAEYDDQFGLQQTEAPALILGGGRVGRAAADTFARTGTPASIVEHLPGRALGPAGARRTAERHCHRAAITVVEGDAADIEVLRDAGLDDASAVLVTPHDDDLNVYLTLMCRRLRPDLQVVARATHERNAATLYRAGADSVLSYTTIGATSLWNDLKLSPRLVIAEGNELFQVPVPAQLSGTDLHNPAVHERTGVHIVAVADADGTLLLDTQRVPRAGTAKLLLLGDRHAERKFRDTYLKKRQSRWLR